MRALMDAARLKALQGPWRFYMAIRVETRSRCARCPRGLLKCGRRSVGSLILRRHQAALEAVVKPPLKQ